MVPVEYVDVRQQLNGLWPCPWPRCTADVLTPEELHEHLDLSHPTGPYYLLRGNDGEIVEMNDISNALVLHKDWGIGEGELYWLVSTFGVDTGHLVAQLPKFFVWCTGGRRLFCVYQKSRRSCSRVLLLLSRVLSWPF